MKRSIAAVTAAVCLFCAGNAFALTVEGEIALLKEDVAKIKAADKGGSIADVLGVTVEAGGTLIFQGTPKMNDGSGNGRNDAAYSLDLGFAKEFLNGGKAFIHIEAGAGAGLDGNGLQTYGGVNRDAGDSANFVEVTEFWYEQALCDSKFTVTFGKLDPAAYFDGNEYANDETTQFISPVFRNNAAIEFADNSAGVSMTYSPAEFADITYAYIASQWDSFDMNGFSALQVNVKPFENGNYRLMCWANNSAKTKIEDPAGETGGYGLALSIDQKLSDIIGVFARYSRQDSSVYEIASAWSIGAQVNGSLWTRKNDTAGLAAGEIFQSSDYTDANSLKDDAETQAELYYNFALTENLAVTPALQYISKPMGANAAVDEDVFVYGIRTQIAF